VRKKGCGGAKRPPHLFFRFFSPFPGAWRWGTLAGYFSTFKKA
jgi:hypothetical protein